MPSNQLECIFDTLPDAVIASDPGGKIIQINAAALKLFEVASASLCRGTPYQQFLHHYQLDDEQQQALSLEPWLTDLTADGGAASNVQEKMMVLQIHPEQNIYVNMSSSPMLDAQKYVVGTIYVFRDITHKYQKALHLQRVHHSMLTLIETIGQASEHMDLAFPRETLLLSPPVLAVAYPLVDMICQVLDCQYVSLLALGPPAGQLYFVAGSGFTSEQEQNRREKSACYFPFDFVDARTFDRLQANEVVILPTERLHFPPGFTTDVSVKHYLIVPLFLEDKLAGALVIARADFSGDSMIEGIELVRVVAADTMLVIEYSHCLYKQARPGARALVQQEMHHLVNEFLNIASHELKTPLTAIKGNIQVAQRRLATLKRQIAEQPEQASERIEQVQDTLEAAAQNVRLQEQIIQGLIDDARIQANILKLHMKRSDLLVLLREAVARKQALMPERSIVLEIMPPEQVIPIMADAERITRVINIYLEHALSFSPTDQPVTVRLTLEDAVARVSVHDAGPALPVEEQGRIWERFHSIKRMAGEHARDLGFGLDFYLSRAFIERHHGCVGVQSDAGHCTTLWFTLPVEAS